MSTLERAIAIAADAHAGQSDKGGAPYILHPLRVMQRVMAEGWTGRAAIVAVLHDVIEDCPEWSQERLQQEGFDWLVLDAIEALTRKPGETYSAFIERCQRWPLSRLVKLADLEDNMDLSRLPSITPDDEVRQERYRKAHALLSVRDRSPSGSRPKGLIEDESPSDAQSSNPISQIKGDRE